MNPAVVVIVRALALFTSLLDGKRAGGAVTLWRWCAPFFVGVLAAGCTSVNAYVLPDAFSPQSDANVCFQKCEQVEERFKARCLDMCPGTLRVKGKACAEIAVGEHDACYQTRGTSPTPVLVLLGVFLLGVLTLGVLALHSGGLAH